MKRTIILFAAICSLISCQKQEEPSLTVSTTKLSSASEGTILTTVITANNGWSASTGADWLKLDKKSGLSGTTTLSITVSKSDSYSERTGEIVVTSATLKQTITVTQSQMDYIGLSKTELLLTQQAGNFTVSVSHNVDVEVSIENGVDWISLAGTKALSTNEYTFSYQENKGDQARQAKIFFKDKASQYTSTLTVNQKVALITVLKYNIVPVSFVKAYKAPLLGPEYVIGTVDWGDGKSSDYASGVSHSYTKSQEYTVTMTVADGLSVEFEDLSCITSIDLSQF